MLPTFHQMGLGTVFTCGDGYLYMRIEDVVYKHDIRLISEGKAVTRNAIRLIDGKLFFFCPDEPAFPVANFTLVVDY